MWEQWGAERDQREARLAAMTQQLAETSAQLGTARAEAEQRRGVSAVLEEARAQSRADLEQTRSQLAEAKGQLAAFCQARPHLTPTYASLGRGHY